MTAAFEDQPGGTPVTELQRLSGELARVQQALLREQANVAALCAAIGLAPDAVRGADGSIDPLAVLPVRQATAPATDGQVRQLRRSSAIKYALRDVLDLIAVCHDHETVSAGKLREVIGAAVGTVDSKAVGADDAQDLGRAKGWKRCPDCERMWSSLPDNAEFVRAHRAAEEQARAEREAKRGREHMERLTLEGMAESMDMFQRDMIAAGVITTAVPPMFMSEAVLGYIGKMRQQVASPAATGGQKAARGADDA